MVVVLTVSLLYKGGRIESMDARTAERCRKDSINTLVSENQVRIYAGSA